MNTSSSAPEVRRMAEAIIATLRAGPVFFMDLVRAHRHAPYRTLLLAWGEVRERYRLARDDDGRYFLADASFNDGAVAKGSASSGLRRH